MAYQAYLGPTLQNVCKPMWLT